MLALRGSTLAPAYASVVLAVGVLGAAAGPFAATSSALPAGMAYEKVSPAQKGDANIAFARRTGVSSLTGTRFAFRSDVAFGGARGSTWPVDYIAELRGSQWETHPITPKQDVDLNGIAPGVRRGVHEFSADLSAAVLAQRDPGLVAGAASGVMNLYAMRTPPAEPGYELLTPAPLTAFPAGFDLILSPAVAAASADARQVVFESLYQLTGSANPGLTNVYEWSSGTLRLASVLPGGATPVEDAVVGRGAGPSMPWAHSAQTDRAVSRDGSRIVFTVGRAGLVFGEPGVSGRVFVRLDGRETKEASASQASIPDPAGPQPATYMTSSRDGRRVFFTSCEKLTDDSTATCVTPSKFDLYRYDVDGERLTDLTAIPSAPSINSVVGSDDDASYLYLGAIDSGLGGFELYLVHDGVVRLVPPSEYVGTASQDLNSPSQLTRQSAVSDDGRHMLFSAETRTDVRDVYIYDGDSGAVRCVSCRPDGLPSTGISALAVNTPVDSEGLPSGGGASTQSRVPRSFNDGGDHVFFHTWNKLVPEDENGRSDVYRYDVADGSVDLISTGLGLNGAFYLDASADGSSIFFATANKVIEGLDEDEFIDIYVARAGATPYRAPPKDAECSGSECQGPLFVAGDPGAPGSAIFAGPDDVDERSSPKRSRVLRIGSVSVTRPRSGRVTVSVRASDPGRITVRMSGRIGRRTRSVASATRTARAGGTIRFAFQLSSAARKQLRKRGRLRVRIAARYASGSGDTVSVTLRATRGSRR